MPVKFDWHLDCLPTPHHRLGGFVSKPTISDIVIYLRCSTNRILLPHEMFIGLFFKKKDSIRARTA